MLLLALVLAPGCSRRRPPATSPGGPEAAVYRARLEDGSGRERRFRLFLFVAEPDRIRGEILTPVGSTRLVVDSGDGRIAVTLVPDRVAFVGDADTEALDALLGVPLSARGWVSAILQGHAEAGFSIERVPRTPGRLPDRLRVETAERGLTLELKQRRALAAVDGIGRGLPPEGVEIRPLSELRHALREGDAP